MVLNHFYDIIDNELEKIIAKLSDNPVFKKLRQDNQKKAYAFLVWFLDFYGQIPAFKEYITDGDGDGSCDIIFSKTNSFGKTMFYVVQAKWNNKKKCTNLIDSMELKQALNDFETVIRGDRKETLNEKFNEKYRELLNHLERNGEVKFVFLSLTQQNPTCNENIQSFRKNYEPSIRLELIDINKIRRDYIEFKYKKISTSNPLEYTYNAEESKISLPIERFDNKQRDFINFEGSYKSYIVILKPRTVYELFEKYKYGLFFKNVRNPFKSSNVNNAIKETLQKRPNVFWYFNNGITAITKLIPPIGPTAKVIEISGLQIINGAQTVYSIYEVYKEANEVQREILDTEARVTLRLIRSNDENFNMQITRYTNSQNEVRDSDFFANDDVQIRLQNESFNTPIWYKIRRGEFTDTDLLENITVASNVMFAHAYVAFYLQQPKDVIDKRDKFFVSFKDDKEGGLYEKIFNEKTNFDDMLASFYLYRMLFHLMGEEDTEVKGAVRLSGVTFPITVHILAFSKIVLELYLNTVKYPGDKRVNLTLFIRKVFEDNDQTKIQLIDNIFDLSSRKLFEKDETESFKDKVSKVIESNTYYDEYVSSYKESGLSEEDIKHIEKKPQNNAED